MRVEGFEGKRITRGDSQRAALGIGVLIVFIAVILVVGMVGYVVIQVAQQLQAQSKATGEQTVNDVFLGVKITTIQGYNVSGAIQKLVMIITPWPGSPQVDLSRMHIELSDTNVKLVLLFNGTAFVNATSGTNNVFLEPAFPTVGSDYGVIVLSDTDNSCTASHPILDRGDNVMLAINTSACFGGIGESVWITGNIIPENGAWSIIDFRTPYAFHNPVIILQQG